MRQWTKRTVVGIRFLSWELDHKRNRLEMKNSEVDLGHHEIKLFQRNKARQQDPQFKKMMLFK